MGNEVPAFVERQEGSIELVVLLHGLGNRSKRLCDVREVLARHCGPIDIYAPALCVAEPWSRVEADDEVARLMGNIDVLWAARAELVPYESISFVGHSIGAIFARKLSILAHGEQHDEQGNVPAPFEARFSKYREPRPWAGKIRRLVLLAGMNRGWLPTSARNWFLTSLLSAGQLAGELLGGKFTIFAIRQGAPFLVQTRLQWLALMNRCFGARPALIVVQLLGTVDDEVAPDDTVDFSIDDTTNHNGVATYNYLDVPLSGHRNIVEMASAGTAETAAARMARRDRFLIAFTASTEMLAGLRIAREHLQDSLPPPPDPAVRDMVFVIHGIRDKGFWTRKVARAIKAEAGQGAFESWTESYGYFAMLPFVLRFVRQRKVAWLMDRYCEARARYPNATFHFVGHSNGTYLAARALLDYPCARFSRIVLAGSVIRCDYPWSRLMEERRVDEVLNYVATRDWVVALFPKGLQPIRFFDLGSAGHDGFDDPRVFQVRHLRGSHGAATQEDTWGDIARFIVRAELPPLTREQPSWLWRGVGKCASLLLAVAAGSLGMVLFLLFRDVFNALSAGSALLLTLLLVAVLATMRLVLLRV